MRITGVILAGGKSSRMGTDKGLLELNGQPLIQYAIDTLKSIGLEIIIISNNSDYEQFGFPVYPDIIPDKGPIGGVYTALSYSSTEKNLIVSCDTPFLSKKLLNYLIDASKNSSIAIAEFEGREHPLIGIYSKHSRDTFKLYLDRNDLKLQNANKALNADVVSLTMHPEVKSIMFSNLNTTEEFKRLEL